VANARIAALEAELNASREAWDIANAAKVTAEKTAKSAETKAKKAEKALADANQKWVQQEQAVAERLDKISVLVGSKCRVVLFCLFAHASMCLYLFTFFCFFLLWCSRKVGVSLKLRQPDTEDPLLAAVD
jgi:multidrug efflux pump subunit AcrA (membrane-fusion protein)